MMLSRAEGLMEKIHKAVESKHPVILTKSLVELEEIAKKLDARIAKGSELVKTNPDPTYTKLLDDLTAEATYILDFVDSLYRDYPEETHVLLAMGTFDCEPPVATPLTD